MRNLVLTGALLLIVAWFVPVLRLGPVSTLPWGPWHGPSLHSSCWKQVLMVVYAKIGKFHHRDRMLNLVNWKGNESEFSMWAPDAAC